MSLAMVPILFALVSCLAFGLTDFLQGLASRRGTTSSIMLVSQTAGMVIILAAAPILGGVALRQDYIWGAISGLLLLLGFALLIVAFRHGRITVAAPIIGVVNIAVPPLYSVLTGNRPGDLVICGLVLGLLAIILVNRRDKDGFSLAPLPLAAAIGAGAAFGGFAIVLTFTSPYAGLWPLVIGYAVRHALLILFLAGTGQLLASIRNTKRTLVPLAGSAGIVVSLASASFLAGLHHGGNLVIMSTIASQSPAVTVLLAMTVSHEKIYRVQIAGLVATAISLLLMGMG